MAGKIWFGIPGKHMTWVPSPRAGAQSSRIRTVESMQYESGGGDVRRSRAFQMQYDFEIAAPLEAERALRLYSDFAAGIYGDENDLIYFADPYIFHLNMLQSCWATPGLAGQG